MGSTCINNHESPFFPKITSCGHVAVHERAPVLTTRGNLIQNATVGWNGPTHKISPKYDLIITVVLALSVSAKIWLHKDSFMKSYMKTRGNAFDFPMKNGKKKFLFFAIQFFWWFIYQACVSKEIEKQYGDAWSLVLHGRCPFCTIFVSQTNFLYRWKIISFVNFSAEVWCK